MSYIPKRGGKASYYIEDEDKWVDVPVVRVYARGSVADIKIPETDVVVPVRVSDLEPPREADINTRFDYYGELATLVLTHELTSLLVSGEGGIGKSHLLEQIIGMNDLHEDVDFCYIKGHCTPLAMYNTLEEWKDKTVIFDDCDSVLKDPISNNILKAVLDTHGRRTVKWLSSRGGERRFDFSGSVVFLSNLNMDKLDEALVSRTITIDLAMTTKEKIERMRYILPTLDAAEKLNGEEREFVIDTIDKYKNTISNLNLRTLIKGLKVYAKSRNPNLLKYQILNT